MKSILVSKTLRAAAALTIAAAIQTAVMATSAHAGLIYDYVGNNFATASGFFSTNDNITGFVEFGSQPAPGATGVTNVVAFSFSAGPFTITNANAVSSAFVFDFDLASPQPGVANWSWSMSTGTPVSFFSCSLPNATCPFVNDNAVAGAASLAIVRFNPGTWTQRAARVPEPGTASLMLTGLAALVLAQALGRRRRLPARP
ncbi:MAG: hypothetical protein ACE5GS_02475 [Kiloniellaceae bacterium]